jgi:hypothetical protein
MLWDAFRHSDYPRTCEGFLAFSVATANLTCTQPEQGRQISQRMAFSALMFSVVAWKYTRADHYFLSPGVAAFCAGSVKCFSAEYSARLPICPRIDVSEYGGGCVPGVFFVHFPAPEFPRSICVQPLEADSPWFFSLTDGGKVLFCPRETPAENVPQETRANAALVFGLSLYMDAFPDAVVPAADGQIHVAKHYHGARHTVARVPAVGDEERNQVSAHWRRGHFRLLTSPKFVHKQGQTVWIHGTFVKGTAFDVLEDTPV